MEDFPVLLLFFILYLIAGTSNKKRKKRPAKSSPMRTRTRGEQYDVRERMRDRQTKEGFQTAFDVLNCEEDQVSCDQMPVHLHHTSQEQMLHAAEGEDPCHPGAAPESSVLDSAEEDEARKAFAQEVLRGVIMSEILTRPCDRMAMRRGGQKGHGH